MLNHPPVQAHAGTQQVRHCSTANVDTVAAGVRFSVFPVSSRSEAQQKHVLSLVTVVVLRGVCFLQKVGIHFSCEIEDFVETRRCNLCVIPPSRVSLDVYALQEGCRRSVVVLLPLSEARYSYK